MRHVVGGLSSYIHIHIVYLKCGSKLELDLLIESRVGELVEFMQ